MTSQLQDNFMGLLENGGDLEKLKRIIDNPEFDVNGDIEGVPVIFSVAYEARIDVLDYLIEKGADINILSSSKSNVLLYILNHGAEMLDEGSLELAGNKFRTANYLIDKGIDIDYIDPTNGNTALDIAINHNLIDILNHLLKKNVEMTKKEKKRVNEILGIPNEPSELEPLSEENISEGDIRQITDITTNVERHRTPSLLSPRYNQEQNSLCWAFAIGRVMFKYIFKGIQIGFLHSNINLGKHYYKKNNFSEYFSSLSQLKTLNHRLTLTHIKYLFSGSITDTTKIFNIPSEFRHINYDADPTFIRQSIILFYLIIFFIGTRCDFSIDKRIYDDGEYSRNYIKLINSFIKFILDRKIDYNISINIGIKQHIYDYFIHFGYSKELVDYITIFFIKLGLKPLYPRSLLPDNKPTNINKRFLYFYHSYKKDKINVDEIKLIFRDAKQQGLYVLISFDNTIRLLDIAHTSIHGAHSMYAIPVDNEKFILKNSWNDRKTDKVVYFRDLISYDSAICIHYLYYNYNNLEQKTRRIPSFQHKPRKSFRPLPIRRINSQVLLENRRPSLTRRKSLSLSASKSRKINRVRTSFLEELGQRREELGQRQRRRLRPSFTRRHSL